VREILIAIGEDPDRDGLERTPARVARAYAELFAGLRVDPAKVLTTTFEANHEELVLVRDIEVYSLCEHHLLPFFGKAHIGYLPRGKVVGLSKLPRLMDVFARRLQVQERLTRQIAECIQEILDPAGVGVIIEASHLCMMMRGVEKQQSVTRTQALLGALKDDDRARAEFLGLIGR